MKLQDQSIVDVSSNDYTTTVPRARATVLNVANSNLDPNGCCPTTGYNDYLECRAFTVSVCADGGHQRSMILRGDDTLPGGTLPWNGEECPGCGPDGTVDGWQQQFVFFRTMQ